MKTIDEIRTELDVLTWPSGKAEFAACKIVADALDELDALRKMTEGGPFVPMSTIDTYDCTYREGGTVLHCRADNQCLKCRYEAAVEDEREACAQVAEEACYICGNGLAALIRARGKK